MSTRTRRKKKQRKREQLAFTAETQFELWLERHGKSVLDVLTSKQLKQFVKLCDSFFTYNISHDMKYLLTLVQNTHPDSLEKYVDEVLHRRVEFKDSHLYLMFRYHRTKFYEFLRFFLISQDSEYQSSMFSLLKTSLRGQNLHINSIENSLNEMKILQVMDS